MPNIPIASSPVQRLRAMSDSTCYRRGREPATSGAAQAISGTRNASKISTSKAISAPVSPHSKSRVIRRQSFDREFSKAIPSLLRFDRHAREAYKTHPFMATDLYRKVEEYSDAAEALLGSLSDTLDASNTPAQCDTLNRLINATHALYAAFPDWATPPSPSFKDFLHNLMGKPTPLEDVQKHLNSFSSWLESKYALLNSERNDAV